MKSFEPPVRLLMGPGPSETPARVLQAMARPPLGRRDPAFAALVEDTRAGLARAFRGPEHACLPLSGPGEAATEAALANLLEPGDTAVVAVNGVFGGRLAQMAERCGAEVVRVDHAWGEPVDPRRIEAALWARRAKLLAFVHAETSTGVVSDPAPLCALAREHGALTVVDCAASLGGIAVEAQGWGADVLCAAGEQCLSAPSGLAPLALGSRAQAAVKARKTPPRTWLQDFGLLTEGRDGGGGGGGSGRTAAPVNAVYGLHEALVAVFEEGLEPRFARHARMHAGLVAGLEALGLSLPVAPAHRLPQLNLVVAPPGVDEARVRAAMLERFGVEIGGGLGAFAGKAWRIGLMGASATPRHVRLVLAALADALAQQQPDSRVQDALDAADTVLG